MLDFGGVGSGGWENRCTTTILVAFMTFKGSPSMFRRACLSLLSFAVGMPILVLPSCSPSPALLHHLCLLSFDISPPKDHAIELSHSRNLSLSLSCSVLASWSSAVHFMVPRAWRWWSVLDLRTYSILLYRAEFVCRGDWHRCRCGECSSVGKGMGSYS